MPAKTHRSREILCEEEHLKISHASYEIHGNAVGKETQGCII